jgi:hypothetical protein
MSLNPGLPIVDNAGFMSEQFKRWQLRINLGVVLTGAGSPEGVVKALQTQQYMNTAGTSGNILWIKRDSDIGGDASMGWVLV